MPTKTEFLLVIFYWAIFSVICLKAKFMAVEGLNKKWVVFMLAVKVIGGILYGYIHNKYYWGGDAQLFFDIGKINSYVGFIFLLRKFLSYGRFPRSPGSF